MPETEVKLARKRVESEKEERLRAWYEELQERESEVVETLQHEGVYTETAFVLSHDDVSYLYIYMEAANLKKALEAGEDEEFEIDEEHHEALEECLTGEWENLEAIGHFVNPDRTGRN